MSATSKDGIMTHKFVASGIVAFGTGCLFLLGSLAAGSRSDANALPPDRLEMKPALRRPIAMVQTKDGHWLYTANQRSGSISAIDLTSNRVSSEFAVGQRLADLAITPDDATLVALDEAAGELIVLGRQASTLTVNHRLKLGPTPVSLQLSPDGSRCTVACLWPRQVTVVALGSQPQIVAKLDLPFAPRNQLLVGDNKLVVTEAFGGRLAVIDLRAGKVESVRSFPGHSIRGLALSADRERLLVTNQMLNPLGRAQQDDIHWGNLITNNVHSLRLSAVLDAKADILSGSELLHLGDAGHGAGDPGSVLECGGFLAVALAGVGELALGKRPIDTWQYLNVGHRPTALLPSADNKRLFIACTSADSISVVDLTKPEVVGNISLGPLAELNSADRGEALFYNARLSHDGWLSCNSCHTDGHTNGKLADTLGDGTYGTRKRILSLRGVGDTAPWAWNGSITKLEQQIAKSITSTMQGPEPSAEQVQDLTAYLKTLPPPSPTSHRQADDEQVRRGRDVFAKQSCARCHTPPFYTSGGVYDVGLRDEAGHDTFNPPSLRGVSQGGPYFHDGRAATLVDVFTHQRHQLKTELTKRELEDLLIFLGTL
jgi:cytochrome c peroxidase